MKAGDNIGNKGLINLASKDYAKGYNSAEKKYIKQIEKIYSEIIKWWCKAVHTGNYNLDIGGIKEKVLK